MNAPAGTGNGEREGEFVSRHTPVLVDEIAGMLVKKPNSVFVDMTLGGGGHARAFLPLLPDDNVYVGLDRDEAALGRARSTLAEFGDRIRFVYGNFADAGELLDEYCGRAANVLFDLGLSADQIADPERGFSFSVDGPLDMRADTSGGVTAATVLNNLPERELADIFYRFGEERSAGQIAVAVVKARNTIPIATTSDLVDILARVAPGGRGRHPATKVFQALRIYVNRELEALETGLPTAVDMLAPGGRIFVVSYHSLEDRIAKKYFRKTADEGRIELLSKRVIKPSSEEVAANPTGRSARLRAAEKLR
jgi:16S rRNA (cytosine1402-N4)-methyltransferase